MHPINAQSKHGVKIFPLPIMEGKILHTLIKLGLFLSITISGTSTSAKPSPVNHHVLLLSPRTIAVVVDKSLQRLFLVETKGKLPKITKTMVCATGEVDGDKKVSGDKRTPEGIYFCRRLLIPPALGDKYGVCALPLNYPNLIDRRLHRNGGGIWIHGIDEDRKTKSTQGCVVLGNRDMAYIAKKIHLFLTPVVIVDRIASPFAPRGKTHLLHFLEKWRKAWSHGNIETYISCYASSFSAKGMNLSQWRSYKQRLFKRYHHSMDIRIINPVIVWGTRYGVISFLQIFDAKGFHAKGLKRLYLRKDKKDFKIIGEEWIPFQNLVHAWKEYGKKIAKLPNSLPSYRIVAASSSATAPKDVLLKNIAELLEKWKTSWEKKDFSRYVSFYSKRFRYRSMDLKQWKQYKLKTFQRNGPIRLTLKDVKIKTEGRQASVRFLQIYDSKIVKDIGIKKMVLCQESGGWKILREQWIRIR